jgi:CPA1 family monovalent cation:H+ antiporter
MLDVALLIRDLVFLLLLALLVMLVTRRLAIPYTLGLVVVGIFMSLLGVLPEVQLTPPLVLLVFLPALLFEGAWALSLQHLRENWRPIVFLAGPGVLLSLVVIGVVVHLVTGIDWTTALLLGALLSTTDPVAVLGLFRHLGVNPRLAIIIEGESLFNDGVAGSLYQTLLAIVLLSINGQSSSGLSEVFHGAFLFVVEAGGGILLGLAGGWVVSRVVQRFDDALVETTITIVVAYGVYLLADTLTVSPLMAVIAAGLVLGSYGRYIGMSERTRLAVDNFWSTLAFVANALIFLLVGVQLNPVEFFSTRSLDQGIPWIAGVVVLVVLLSRGVVVLLLGLFFRRSKRVSTIPRSWQLVMFWSGLRGALSLALVLALPTNIPAREVFLASTAAVVLFTLLVQGLSLRWVLLRLPAVMRHEDQDAHLAKALALESASDDPPSEKSAGASGLLSTPDFQD